MKQKQTNNQTKKPYKEPTKQKPSSLKNKQD
jgi:hypothetical protein